MLHFLVLVLGLLGKDRQIWGNVPSFDHKVRATGDKYVVFAIVNIDHIQNYVFVLCDDKIFLEDLFFTHLVSLSDGSLDCERLLVED